MKNRLWTIAVLLLLITAPLLVVKEPAVRLTLERITRGGGKVSMDLPPRTREPEPALNADGVRTDVALAIATLFPDSARLRAAGTQLAKALQMAIDQPENAAQIHQAQYTKAKECVLAMENIGEFDGASKVSHQIEALVVNTYERSRQYSLYNSGLSGGTYDLPRANPASCVFDPRKLEN